MPCRRSTLRNWIWGRFTLKSKIINDKTVECDRRLRSGVYDLYSRSDTEGVQSAAATPASTSQGFVRQHSRVLPLLLQKKNKKAHAVRWPQKYKRLVNPSDRERPEGRHLTTHPSFEDSGRYMIGQRNRDQSDIPTSCISEVHPVMSTILGLERRVRRVQHRAHLSGAVRHTACCLLLAAADDEGSAAKQHHLHDIASAPKASFSPLVLHTESSQQ